MNGLETVFGGERLHLRKRPDKFRVLAPVNKASDVLLNEIAVRDVVGLGPGLSEVEVSDPDRLDATMSLAREELVSHHFYEIRTENGSVPLMLSDRVLLAPQADGVALGDFLAGEFALIPLPSLSDNILAFRLTDATGMNPLKLVNLLQARSDVRWAEPDVFRTHSGLTVANWYPQQWHLAERLAPNVQPNSSVQADEAWGISRGSRDVVLAVFDDGFDLTNPDLADAVVSPADFGSVATDWDHPTEVVPGDASPLPERSLSEYHGTPCAGLAVARGVQNVLGVAPGVSWMPVRMPLGTFGTDSMVLRVFKYISARADVISCSWGNDPSAFTVPSTAMKEVFAEITSSGGRNGKGVVICFAAGNSDLPVWLDAADNPEGLVYWSRKGRRLGSGFFRGQTVHSGWSELDGIVVVGSVTSLNRRAHYSNWGPTLTVVAPSDNFYPDAPQERAEQPEPKLVTTDNEENGVGLAEIGLAVDEHGPVTASMGGTSGATPIAAGVCALILSANPNLSGPEVIEILKTTADTANLDPTLPDPPENSATRNGSFDPVTGHSIWFGHGRVNAHAAVLKAEERNE